MDSDRLLGALLLVAATVTVPVALALTFVRHVLPARLAGRVFGGGGAVPGHGLAYARAPRPMHRLMGPAAAALGLLPVAVSLLRRPR